MNTRAAVHSEERLKILRMLEEGKLHAGEAANLLAALGKENGEARPNTQIPVGGPAGRQARYLRVKVTDTVTGKSKVSVTMPISLVEWGMRIGARFSPEVADLDWQTLSAALQESGESKLVDVIDEEDGEHVEVYVD